MMMDVRTEWEPQSQKTTDRNQKKKTNFQKKCVFLIQEYFIEQMEMIEFYSF